MVRHGCCRASWQNFITCIMIKTVNSTAIWQKWDCAWRKQQNCCIKLHRTGFYQKVICKDPPRQKRFISQRLMSIFICWMIPPMRLLINRMPPLVLAQRSFASRRIEWMISIATYTAKRDSVSCSCRSKRKKWKTVWCFVKASDGMVAWESSGKRAISFGTLHASQRWRSEKTGCIKSECCIVPVNQKKPGGWNFQDEGM